MVSPAPTTRTVLLERATVLFAAHGFDGTTIQTIADALGVSKAAVLHHFPSKEELRTAVLVEVLGHFRQVMPEILRRTAERKSLLEAVFVEVHGFFAARPDAARLLMREALDRPADMRALLSEHVKPWIDLIAVSLHGDLERGDIDKNVDPEAYLVSFLIAIVNDVVLGDVMSCLFQASGRERLRAELRRISRRALVPAPAESPRKRT